MVSDRLKSSWRKPTRFDGRNWKEQNRKMSNKFPARQVSCWIKFSEKKCISDTQKKKDFLFERKSFFRNLKENVHSHFIYRFSAPKNSDHAPKYPSSSAHRRDWDKLDKDFQAEIEAETPEGDQALNQLFQKIYADGTDETKRAMMKSFVSIIVYNLLISNLCRSRNL